MKNIIKKIPLLNTIATYLYIKLSSLFCKFEGSEKYWETRYRLDGNSGDGSYDNLCAFKADVLNSFVKERAIEYVIEFGCGDGNQLKYAAYPSYLGLDVSSTIIRKCQALFANDVSKVFKLMNDYSAEKAPLSLSLDVIYHLVEDDTFNAYMRTLFQSSTRYIIIYSSNTDMQQKIQAPHVKHRKFSDWVAAHFPEWVLMEHKKNKFPYSEKDQTGSFADFYIYENKSTPEDVSKLFN